MFKMSSTGNIKRNKLRSLSLKPRSGPAAFQHKRLPGPSRKASRDHLDKPPLDLNQPDNKASTELWQLSHENIAARIQYLYKCSLWTDCTVNVGKNEQRKEFKIHKLVLSAASPVFEALFQKDKKDASSVDITDMRPATFRAILDYAYTDAVDLVNMKDACDILQAAQTYLMPRLKEVSKKFIIDCLTPENACKMLEFSTSIGCTKLQKQCLRTIRDHIYPIAKDPAFLKTNSHAFLLILQQDSLAIESEGKLYELAIHWAKRVTERKGLNASAINIRTSAISALRHIRFLAFPKTEFQETVMPSGILNAPEASAILSVIMGGRKGRVKIPDWVNTDSNPRAILEICNWSDSPHETIQCISDVSTRFSVTHDILLRGFQLSASSRLEPDTQTEKESCTVSLLDQAGDCIRRSTFTFHENPELPVETFFARPIQLKNGVTYVVQIAGNNFDTIRYWPGSWFKCGPLSFLFHDRGLKAEQMASCVMSIAGIFFTLGNVSKSSSISVVSQNDDIFKSAREDRKL